MAAHFCGAVQRWCGANALMQRSKSVTPIRLHHRRARAASAVLREGAPVKGIRRAARRRAPANPPQHAAAARRELRRGRRTAYGLVCKPTSLQPWLLKKAVKKAIDARAQVAACRSCGTIYHHLQWRPCRPHQQCFRGPNPHPRPLRRCGGPGGRADGGRGPEGGRPDGCASLSVVDSAMARVSATAQHEALRIS